MSGIRITTETHELAQLLGRTVGRLQRPKSFFGEVGEVLLRSTQDRFEQEQDPDGRAWAALKAATLKRKRAQSRILKILQERGDMRGSLAYQASDQGVTVGYRENSPKAAVHHFGSAKRKIPARPHLGVSRRDEAVIVAVLERYLGGT